MADIKALLQANKISLQDIFLVQIREQLKALGATSIIWHQNLSEERSYTEVLGPFIVIDGDALLPQSKLNSYVSDRYVIVERELRKVAKNQSLDKINRTEKGGIRIKEVELDVSELLNLLGQSDSLGYAFGCDYFVWVTLDSYFVEYTDLFCSFD